MEQLQQALNHPEIRDEAVQILRGLIEHVSIGPADHGLEIEIGFAPNVQATAMRRSFLDDLRCGGFRSSSPTPAYHISFLTRSVKVVAEARNRLDLQLQELLATILPT